MPGEVAQGGGAAVDRGVGVFLVGGEAVLVGVALRDLSGHAVKDSIYDLFKLFLFGGVCLGRGGGGYLVREVERGDREGVEGVVDRDVGRVLVGDVGEVRVDGVGSV